jgi:predicted helicase
VRYRQDPRRPFLAERLKARRVLVLVPSLSLLSQTLREWTTAVNFDYLAVCSVRRAGDRS